MSECFDYVRRTYGVNPHDGQRVRHQVTGKFGTVKRARSALHYVHVQFDGQKHKTPCHPTELDYDLQALVS